MLDTPLSESVMDGNLFYPSPEIVSGNITPDPFSSDIYRFVSIYTSVSI